MSYLTLSRNTLTVDFTGHKVWYDEANNQLVLLKNALYTAVPLLASGAEAKPIALWQRDGAILDVKISLSGLFMACQRSDTLVELVPLTSKENATSGLKKPDPKSISTLVCRPKKGNCILRGGMIWLRPKDSKSECFVLVTKFGLEVHKLESLVESPKRSSKKRDGVFSSVKLVGVVKHTIQCFWYLPSRQIVVIATSSGNEMRPYFLNSSAPVKLAKFLLPATPLQRDVLLVELYGSPFCVHIDSIALQLRLFSLKRDVSHCETVLKLFGVGSFGVSVIDNLLCVHNMEAKVSLLYDTAVDTTDPIVNPMSISCPEKLANTKTNGATRDLTIPVGTSCGLEEGEHGLQITCPALGINKTEEQGVPLLSIDDTSVEGFTVAEARQLLSDSTSHRIVLRDPKGTLDAAEEDGMVEPYSQSWVFLPPDWILEARAGSLWQLRLDTEAITQCYRNDNVELVTRFLMRRRCTFPLDLSGSAVLTLSYSKLVFLDYLLHSLSDAQSLSNCSKIFREVNDAYAEYQRWQEEGSLQSANDENPILEPTVQDMPFECTVTRWRNTTLTDVVPTSEPQSETFPVIIDPKPKAIFDMSAQEEKRTRDGCQVLSQAEMFFYVFMPLVAKQSTPLDYEWPATVLLEYVRSLIARSVVVEKYILLLLASLCAGARMLHTLLQLIQHCLLPDSTLLAELLVAVAKPGDEGSKEPVFQAGLDVYHRLGRLDTIVDLLLERGEIYTALRFIGRRDNSLSLESLDLAVRCFRAAQAESSRSLTLSVFGTLHSFILTSNPSLVSRSHPTMSSKNANGNSQSLLASLVQFPKVERIEQRVMLVDMFGFAVDCVEEEVEA